MGLLLGVDDEELEEDDESLLEFEGPAVALGLPLRGDNTAEAEEAAGDRGTSLDVDGLVLGNVSKLDISQHEILHSMDPQI